MSTLRRLVIAAVALLALAIPSPAQVCNVKVVTDASPDYTDMPSMVRSICGKWETPKEKMWALFYWNHIGRRQTAPMMLRGVEVIDPIMQFNDYGFTMCSTVSGVNCSIWDFMGMPTKYYEIGLHTVCEVGYDDRFHCYDSSLSAIYTLCDGKTIAGVNDIGAKGSCEASGGKEELGHIAKYHCLTATSNNGFLIGADCSRSVDSEAKSFNPNNVKYQYFYKCATWGHRYILNLRDGEVYTRYYRRLDADSPNAVEQNEKNKGFKADPAYFVPREFPGKDLEAANPRYHIRGNGVRVWKPSLKAEDLPSEVYSMSNIKGIGILGIGKPDSKPGEIIFKVEGANVISSMRINASFGVEPSSNALEGSDYVIAVSVDGGRTWKDAHKGHVRRDELDPKLNLISEVNGAYDVLVRVQLLGWATLSGISFETITQVNSKTQPKLNVGQNTVYVGTGEQTESIVISPDLRAGKHSQYVKEVKNLVSVASADYGRYAQMYIEDAAVPKGYVVFKVDSPTDITSITYGGRFCVRAPKSYIELSYSFDDGKTWNENPWTLKTTEAPWDTTHYETFDKVPPGTKSVLFKYYLFSNEGTPAMCGIYSARMEVNHKVAESKFKPLEVTFNWNERQADYSLVPRSHTQLVDKVPFRYTINVGGADHPVMESLTVNVAGSRKATGWTSSQPVGWAGLPTSQPASASAPTEVKYGYSDGKDAGGKKWSGRWVTYGKNLAEGKPYVASEKSGTQWGSGDPDGKKLTDGVVAAPYAGGTTYGYGVLYAPKTTPLITVDLGKSEKCGAFAIQMSGWEIWDSIKGQNKDKVEVLTSADGENFASQGFFDLNFRWKDIPVNHMWTDEETFTSPNFYLVLDKPVDARYVRFKLTPARSTAVSEVQVYDQVKYDQFDLKLALPDEKVK